MFSLSQFSSVQFIILFLIIKEEYKWAGVINRFFTIGFFCNPKPGNLLITPAHLYSSLIMRNKIINWTELNWERLNIMDLSIQKLRGP